MTDEELKYKFDSLRLQGTKTNKKRTEEDLRARFDYLQAQGTQQAQQPATQPVAQQSVQAQPTPAATQPTQPVVEQPKTTTTADKLKSGARLTPEETIQAAVEMGKITPEEAEFQKKKLNASKQVVANTYANPENYEKAKAQPVQAVEKAQGKEDAKQVQVTKENAADTYIKAREKLQEAKATNNTREIAKNEAIVEEAKNKYKANNNEQPNIDIPSLRNKLTGLAQDLDKIKVDYDNAITPEQQNRLADEYNATLEQFNEKQKVYNNAVAYDEIVNNNMVSDIGKSSGIGFLAGVGKIENGVYAAGNKLSGMDATTINADSLLRYNNNDTNWTDYLKDAASMTTKISPYGMAATATGALESPNAAYQHLVLLASANPDNIGLKRLFNQITNHTYQGTAEDLRNELDKIQKELYQGFKDVSGTYNTLTKEREQLAHNENVYENAAFIPNAFNTVTNMLPSQMLAPIGGEALTLTALGLGAGSQGMDEALESGARYNQAFNYGVATGATEAATEKMFESGLNKAIGIKGTLDPSDLSKKLIDSLGIKNSIGKAVINTLGDTAGEMTEEMVAEAVNPLWRYITYDQDAFKNFNPKQILQAGVDAIPSTLLMEATGLGIQNVKVNQIERGIIKSINTSELSPIVKNQLINEVRKAGKEVKSGLEEADYINTKVNEKSLNLSTQSEQMKQRIPKGYTLPQSTVDILAYTENNRPGLNITFDPNIQGNGAFTENPDGTRTITLNPNSKRAVEFTLTHELGHDLKGTNEYVQLQNILTDYAKGNPGYQEALKQLDKTYKESGANYNLQDEATNDMLGEAIGEQEFYNKLAENPTLFNRVTNELKNLLGNKDTKLKNKIEKLTSNALKQEYRGKQEGTQQSLSKNKVFKKDIANKFRELTGDPIDGAGSKIAGVELRNYWRKNGIKDGELEAYPYSDEAMKLYEKWENSKQTSSHLYHATGIDRLESIIKNGLTTGNKPNYEGTSSSKEIYLSATPENAEHYAPKDSVTLRISPKFYDKFENFREDWLGGAGTYAITNNIPPEMLQIKENGKWIPLLKSNQAKQLQNNTQYSLSEAPTQDNQGRTLTPEQQEFFKDSKVRDNEGRLVRVYHMTNDNFNKVDFRKNAQGLFWFASSKEDLLNGSVSANGTRNKANSNIKEMYVNMKKPATWEEYDRYGIGQLQEMGYDGILLDEGDGTFVGAIFDNANQVKNIDNLTPTNNADMRYQKQNTSWQQFLDNTYGKWDTGTKTNFEMLPSNEELKQAETKQIAEEPIAKMTTNKSLNSLRDFKEVGNKKVNAYQYENPEVKPFFQHEAENMLMDLDNAIKGERTATWDDYGELHYSGTTREVTKDIAQLLDGDNGVKLSYDDIRKGLNAIIKDQGSENIAAAKRIEMVLDERLRKGYTDSFGTYYEPNENYMNFLEGKEYIDPAEYEKQRADRMIEEQYGDNGQYSLSEKETAEVNDYIDKMYEDKTLDETFKDQVINRLNNVQNYSDFEAIRDEVSNYKDKLYKGISGLVDIANSTEEDVKQREMEYKQRKDKNTPNQRKFFENVETSNIIADETKNRINATTYEVKHNLDTLEKMKERLDERGNDLVEEWEHKSKNFNDNDVALGAILIERYQQKRDFESAARTAEKLADMATESARALQMYSIWQRLSPETMQLFAQRQLNQAFEEMKKRQTGKWVEANKDKFKLTAEESQFIYEQVEKASQAIDDETKQRELSKIENMINNKLPPEKGQTIKALRRIAMLLNPKTQVRNIAGNTLIMPVNDVADLVGTAIDKAVARKTGVRTTSTPNLITKAKGFGKGIKAAVTDYKTGTRTTASGSKYEFDLGAKPFNENTNSKVRNNINRMLNGVNDLLSAVMSGGDRPFYEAAYQNSLEGQMKANKVTEPTQEMKDIAVNEALQRTWNDDNNYTKTVLSIRKAMNNINIKGFGLGDLIIPFAKTPANLTKAMVEYSPAGFIESVIDFNDMRKAISRGEMTPMQQKKFVASTSKAIAGSLLYLIAGTLVKAGKITGSADDDKDVKNFEQNVLGIQPYSVRIGDKTYTYSWANPINAPLAIMADTYKMSKEDASKWDILNNAFKVAGETLVDNSFLQGIKELFSKDSISEGIVDAIESFPESMIPTFLSQIASLNDSKQRQTFEYQNDLQTIANKIKNKIPGLRNTLEPQVNTFGEEIENQNNAFNAFLNPANVREARITDEQKALYDVYQETKDKTIFPMQAPYYVSDNGKKKNLTSQERVDYQKASGNYVSEVYDGLFNQEDAFNNNFHVQGEGKVKILKKIAEDGNTKGKEAVGVTTKTTDSLNEKIDALQDAGIPLADYYLMWYHIGAGEDKKNNTKKIAINETIRNLDHDITTEQKKVLYEIFDVK